MLAIRRLLTRTNLKLNTFSKDCISVILPYCVVNILCLGEIRSSECVENRAYMHGYGREAAECFFALWLLKG